MNLEQILTIEEVKEIFDAGGVKEKGYRIEGDYVIVRHAYANRDSKYGLGERKLRRVIEVLGSIRAEEFYILGRTATDREAEYFFDSLSKEKS